MRPGRGDLDAAERHAERLADYADESDSPILRAESRLADGRIAAARGDDTASAAALQAGIDELDREQRPILAATIRLELANSLADRRETARETDEARAAQATFERLGATLNASRCEPLIDRLVAATPAPRA